MEQAEIGLRTISDQSLHGPEPLRWPHYHYGKTGVKKNRTMKLVAGTRNSWAIAFAVLCFGLVAVANADSYRIKGEPTAPLSPEQKVLLATYDAAWQVASEKFEVELIRRIPDFRALKNIFEQRTFEAPDLLRNEVAALLLTLPNSDGPAVQGDVKYDNRLELERIANRWFDKTGRGYWAIIRAAQEQAKDDDALANQWFARALSAGFVDNELRQMPALLLQVGQAWIAADFPKLTPELTLLGRRSNVGFVAAEMMPQILMPAEMIWGAALAGLCIDADQLPIDANDALVLEARSLQCKKAKKLLLGQESRRLAEYGVTDIPATQTDSDFDDQLLAPFKALDCQLDNERDYIERLTRTVESIEDKSLGLYLQQLEKRCEK